MNHIEMYENLLIDFESDWELKALVKQFYSMPVEQANKATILITELITTKVNDFMTMGE